MTPASLSANANANANGDTVPLLALRGLRQQRGQGRRKHFELQVDACFEQPEVIGLFGANGAGKSTLLDLIAGHSEPHRGQVSVRGHDIHCVRRSQRSRLVGHHPQPHVAPVASAHGVSLWHGLQAVVKKARVALGDLLRRKAPWPLPIVHLYDEPPMHPLYAGWLFDRFASLRAQGHWVMFCTHPTEAAHLRLVRGVCDRYAFMQDGRLRFFMSFDSFVADPEVADYLGSIGHSL